VAKKQSGFQHCSAHLVALRDCQTRPPCLTYPPLTANILRFLGLPPTNPQLTNGPRSRKSARHISLAPMFKVSPGPGLGPGACCLNSPSMDDKLHVGSYSSPVIGLVQFFGTWDIIGSGSVCLPEGPDVFIIEDLHLSFNFTVYTHLLSCSAGTL
jgi:hypothetical protein